MNQEISKNQKKIKACEKKKEVILGNNVEAERSDGIIS